MRTLIIQSYRAIDVPKWIKDCMASVYYWAKERNYDYKFIDDDLFNYVPAEFRVAKYPKIVQTDFARLIACRKYLGEYDRVVWMDADLLIFNTGMFEIETPTTDNMVMCQETWHIGKFLGVPVFDNRINNACMIFKDVEPLDMLINLSKFVLRNSFPNNWMLGPTLMTPLMQKIVTNPQLQRGVACMGPNVLASLYKNPVKYGKQLSEAYGCPLYAVNLCHSFSTEDHNYCTSPQEMLGVVNLLKEYQFAFSGQFHGPNKPVKRVPSTLLKNYLRVQKPYRVVRQFLISVKKQLTEMTGYVSSLKSNAQ